MSFILEALKKSEQERGQQSTPNVQTIHTSSLQYQQQKKSLWPYVLTIVVLINMAVLGYFMMNQTNTRQTEITTTQQTISPATPAAAPASATPAPTAAVDPAQVQRIIPATPVRTTQAPVIHRSIQPPASSSTSPQPAYIATAAVSPRAFASSQTQPSDLYDLPIDVQAAIPDMTFSAHVYSSNPVQRSVVINGNFMEEGDMLTASLRLDEITRDGVIFDYEGTRFRSSVISGWSVN